MNKRCHTGIILPKKALHEYGVTETDIDEFTEIVMTKQSRLMANNYTEPFYILYCQYSIFDILKLK